MQTKKEFMEELVKTINSLMGDGYRAEIHCIEKINTGKLHALIILNGENCISPNFYIDGFYKDYRGGKATIDGIAKGIVNVYYNNTCMQAGGSIHKCLDDREWVEERLFLQLINTGKNKELLKDSLYMDFKGLSLVLYIMAMDNDEGLCKIRVTKAMCQKFGWNEKETLHHALENTEKLFPYSVFPLYELLQKTIDSTDITIKDIPPVGNGMMVLTNNRGINGALAAFYPGVLKEISEKHGKSLFLLPSSIHEFIILEDNGIYNPEQLEQMVMEVNRSAVEPEEILSDNVYYYGFISGILSVFNNGSFEEIYSFED